MIIGIAGKAQAGKDTACKIIQAVDLWEKMKNKEINMITTCKTEEEFCKEWAVHCFTDTIFLNQSDWERRIFAGKLKECAAILLNCSAESFDDIDFKNKTTFIPLYTREGELMTNRQFLQYLGTEVGRAIDPDLWVKTTLTPYCNGKKWIIPDVRFPNEEKAIHDRGGFVWRIDRDEAGAGNHESEKWVDKLNVNLVIDNNDTIEEFIKLVIRAYKYTLWYYNKQ